MRRELFGWRQLSTENRQPHLPVGGASSGFSDGRF